MDGLFSSLCITTIELEAARGEVCPRRLYLTSNLKIGQREKVSVKIDHRVRAHTRAGLYLVTRCARTLTSTEHAANQRMTAYYGVLRRLTAFDGV